MEGEGMRLVQFTHALGSFRFNGCFSMLSGQELYEGGMCFNLAGQRLCNVAAARTAKNL